MLLTPWRTLRRRLRDDDGSTLVPALGLVAVAAIVTLTVTAVTVQSMGFTTGSRAGVQARAAADAGVEFARAAIETGNCPADGQVDRDYGEIDPTLTGTAAARPYFEATIQHKVVLTGTWTNGCPAPLLGDLLNYQVRIESTGYAQDPGVNGVSAFDDHTVEAVFGWSILGTPPQQTIRPTGAAVYAYSSSSFGGGGTLYSVNGSVPDITIKTGNVICSGGSDGIQSLVVDGGSLTIKGGCDVDGNVWSSGRTTLEGGVNVGGDIVANGITHRTGGTVGGTLWSSSDITISGGGRANGNAIANSLSVTNGDLGGDAFVNGKTTLAWGGFIEGSVTTRSYEQPSGQPQSRFIGQPPVAVVGSMPPGWNAGTPARPPVAGWIDYAYTPSDWEGFTTLSLSGSTCTYSQLQAKVDSLGGQPGVIDARGCGNGIAMNGDQELHFDANLALIANKFSLTEGAGMRSANAVKLWLITPDPPGLLGGILNPILGSAKPDCKSGSSFAITGGFDFSDTIATMIYTPCKVHLGTGIDTFRGQLFVGQAQIDGGAELGYVKVGLPGVDLDTGEEDDGGILPPILDLGSLGELEYYQDLPGPTVP